MKNNKSINISYMYQQKKNPERDSFFVDIRCWNGRVKIRN